jgi:hypothetical protein
MITEIFIVGCETESALVLIHHSPSHRLEKNPGRNQRFDGMQNGLDHRIDGSQKEPHRANRKGGCDYHRVFGLNCRTFPIRTFSVRREQCEFMVCDLLEPSLIQGYDGLPGSGV